MKNYPESTWQELLNPGRPGSSDPLAPVTVRIPLLDMAHVELLAECLGQTRQFVIATMIGLEIPNAFLAILDAEPDEASRVKKFKELNEQVIARWKKLHQDMDLDMDFKGYALSVPWSKEIFNSLESGGKAKGAK